MSRKLKGLSGFIVVTALAALQPTIASADEITVTFALNGLTLTGEFVGFEDNEYIIDTTVGTVNVAADLVSLCEGIDCISAAAAAELNN